MFLRYSEMCFLKKANIPRALGGEGRRSERGGREDRREPVERKRNRERE